ncbi:hypothetical protein [Streptococcus thermophilus]|uniref:hypothetical protein n=1 Tax=Streptococcus thermophilus TaxID=1308 RepID=UPI000AAABB28|nr:hypothetical protein [Streptococcus thermophilus]
MSTENCDNKSFGTIRNNTALKHKIETYLCKCGFGTIRNNTALKQTSTRYRLSMRFGTIRNNTALKLEC